MAQRTDHRLRATVAGLRRRVGWALWTRELGFALAALGFVAGGALVLLRFGIGVPRADASHALWILALAPLVAWWRAAPRRISERGALAWLDARAGGTGELVTAEEAFDERWSERVDARLRALPKLRWRTEARAFGAALPAFAFVVGALLFERTAPVIGPPPTVALAALDEAREKLAALEETLELEPELSAELAERADAIEAQLGEARPEATFEAIDRLAERLEREAADALDASREAGAGLDAAARESASDPEAARDALEASLGALVEAGLGAELAQTLETSLGAATLELPPGLELDPAQLASLAEDLAEDLAAAMQDLANAGLLDPAELGRLGELGQGGELAKLGEFRPHVCDESCEKPGGT